MKIKNINKNKNNYKITFDNGECLSLDEDLFTDYYFYVDKDIDENEYETINQKSNLIKEKNYLISLLSKKNYSTNEIIFKLKNKNISNDNINYLIEYLTNNNLLNDEIYFNEYIEFLNLKNYGYYKIKEKLIQKGFMQELEYNKKIELEKINNILPTLIKKYSKESQNKKIILIKNSLLNNGFDFDLINEVLMKINTTSYEEEISNLKRDYNLIFIKSQNKPEKERTNYIINKLKMKGYKYNDIIMIVNQGGLI